MKMETEQLIQALEKQCKSSGGFMGVNVDGIKTQEDLFENIKDEILSITEVTREADIEEEFGMTIREAKGYVKKLNTFLEKYEPISQRTQ